MFCIGNGNIGNNNNISRDGNYDASQNKEAMSRWNSSFNNVENQRAQLQTQEQTPPFSLSLPNNLTGDVHDNRNNDRVTRHSDRQHKPPIPSKHTSDDNINIHESTSVEYARTRRSGTSTKLKQERQSTKHAPIPSTNTSATLQLNCHSHPNQQHQVDTQMNENTLNQITLLSQMVANSVVGLQRQSNARSLGNITDFERPNSNKDSLIDLQFDSGGNNKGNNNNNNNSNHSNSSHNNMIPEQMKMQNLMILRNGGDWLNQHQIQAQRQTQTDTMVRIDNEVDTPPKKRRKIMQQVCLLEN